MTLDEAEAYLARITYKPGVTYTVSKNRLFINMPVVNLVSHKHEGEILTTDYGLRIEELTEYSFGIAIWLLTMRSEHHEISEWLQLDGKPLMPAHSEVGKFV